MGLSLFEFRRQLAHIIFGLIVVGLIFVGWATAERVLISLPIALGMLKLLQAGHFPILSPAFNKLERENDMKINPGISIMVFLVALWLLLFALENYNVNIVMGSVIIWAFGDSIGHIFGASFGRISTTIDRTKKIEGVVVAFLFAVLAARIFVQRDMAIAGAGVGVFVELLKLRVLGRRIPDNFTVPLAAAFAMVVVGLL